MSYSSFSSRHSDPFSRIPVPRQPDPEIENIQKLFRLTGSVGMTASNNRRDVAKIEILMDRTGYLDLRQTDGPTGYYGERLKQAVEKFQKDHNLKKDGLVRPQGETIRKLAHYADDVNFGGDERNRIPGNRPRRRSPKILPPDPLETRDRMNIPSDNLPGTQDEINIKFKKPRPRGEWI